jgi:hypothetical protein
MKPEYGCSGTAATLWPERMKAPLTMKQLTTGYLTTAPRQAATRSRFADSDAQLSRGEVANCTLV